MPRLTGRGWAFLVVAANLAALAYGLERPELLPLAVVAAAAPIVGLIVVAASRPRLAIGRHLQPVVATVDEPVRVEVLVSGRARAAEWIERVPMTPGYAGPGRLAEVRPRRTRALGYRYWPERRGLASVGPLLIEDRDPFALAVRVTSTVAVTTQLVLPAVEPLPAGPVPDPSAESGPRSSRSRERADDDVITREYRSGDAMRRVHWRVSARQGELMVRQDEPQAGPRARLLVDDQRSSYPDHRPRREPASPAFEWSVRMAASAAAHLAERGYAVDLVTPSPRADDAPAADGPVGRVLGELAVLELAPAAPLDAVPGTAASVPLVAVACRPDAGTVQWMLAQRAPGSVAVALLVAPSGPVADGPAGREAEDAFRRAGWLTASVEPTAPLADAWWSLLGRPEDRTPAEALLREGVRRG
ncbi:DUF58 domain-containing protein [Microcella flavibacter]|uniref:DUF58 domain-containing protein n=1 Tax=Microcella flavibacter TaxID=1804990 RepID=UPI0014577F5C|nr:DUF58 domain-containing protein [Microcella flavibacter]